MAGNHEQHYGDSLNDCLEAGRKLARVRCIHFLDNKAMTIGGMLVSGAKL